jgi:predicted Zn finger-like uncharacterized protein
MDIICRHCNATYTIPDHKLPPKKSAAKCKRCGNRIIIDPPVAGIQSNSVATPAPSAVQHATPVAQHDRQMMDAFPEISDFAPGRYAMADILKPNRKGNYRTRLNKLKLKILAAVKPTLDRLLKKDERVLRIAAGTAYYPIEILFGNGIFTMLYNRYALVATDRRLVMVNTNHRMTKPGHYLFQMGYDEIKKVSRGLFRTSLTLTRKKGKRRLFTSMKMAFTAELSKFVTPRMTSGKALPSGDAVPENLCPSCFAGLPAGIAKCTVCRAAFKTPKNAALRSLLLPGWGDWYLGHRFLGGCELAGSLIVWSIVFGMLAEGGAENVVIAVLIIAFYNGFDALLTRHMARKGCMLESRQSTVDARSHMAADPA